VERFVVDASVVVKWFVAEKGTEGFEYEILEGASETISKFKPKMIVEVHSEELREKIIKFLLKDYSLVYVTASEAELIKRRKEVDGRFLSGQLEHYSKLAKLIEAYKIDITGINVNESLKEVFSLLSMR